MNDFLILEDDDMNFIWDSIQELQVIFHPDIAPDGEIDIPLFYKSKRWKPFCLVLDRNILSGLLEFCEKGVLRSKGEAQIIGLIMVWAIWNRVPVSAGLAVRERAAQLQSQEMALIELAKFQEIFKFYPSQMWLEVAEGRRTDIPPIRYTQELAEELTVDFTDAGDHYEMALASLLHAVRLYRDRSMKPVEKMLAFLEWSYINLLISEYLMVYIAMLFTDQENIKAPKHANSDNFDRVVAGCENQAWDFSYLTNWSTLYSYPQKYEQQFLFATNDILLKRIFINRHQEYGFNAVLFEVFPQKEYDQLMDYIEYMSENRVKPDFGEKPHEYFQNLIEREKQELAILLGCT